MNGEIQELKNLIESQGKQIAAIFESVEKTRKYFLWTMIITVALFILPLIGMMFAIPSFLNTYSNPGALGL